MPKSRFSTITFSVIIVSAHAPDLLLIIGQTKPLQASSGNCTGRSLSFLSIVHCFDRALFTNPVKMRSNSVISLSAASGAAPGGECVSVGAGRAAPWMASELWRVVSVVPAHFCSFKTLPISAPSRATPPPASCAADKNRPRAAATPSGIRRDRPSGRCSQRRRPRSRRHRTSRRHSSHRVGPS